MSSGNVTIFDISKNLCSWGTKRMTSMEDSHAVGFDGTKAGMFQLLQRLSIEMCLPTGEKFFLSWTCSERLWIARPGGLPSSCSACRLLGSPCGHCQTENETSWVITGSI